MENGKDTQAIYKIVDRKKLEVVNKPITESHGLPNECYISQDYTKIERTNIKLSTAFTECEVLGEMARGEMVTDVLSEVDDYWKNRNIVVDKCMNSKGFELK